MEAPETSSTLLRTISTDANSARWAEFVSVYRPFLIGYLQHAYPALEAEDIVQETLLAVVKVLPNFVYDPDENGHFHNWIIGVARHKAQDIRRAQAKEIDKNIRFTDEQSLAHQSTESKWHDDVLAVAIRKLMSDDSFSEQSKIIFQRVAVKGESPEVVANQFGITRNNVDQIKNRMINKLKHIVEELKNA